MRRVLVTFAVILGITTAWRAEVWWAIPVVLLAGCLLVALGAARTRSRAGAGDA